MAKKMSIPKVLYNEVAIVYSKEHLDKYLMPFVSHFLKKNGSLCLSEGIPIDVYSKTHKRYPKKDDVVQLCCIPFLSEKLVAAFKEILPPPVLLLLEELTWQKELDEDTILERFNIEISVVKKAKHSWLRNTRSLKDWYLLFLIYSNPHPFRTWSLFLVFIGWFSKTINAT